MQNRFNILGLTLVILLASCSSSEDEQIQEELSSSGSTEIGLIDDERILAAESEPGNWLAHGRTYEERRFSPLNKINKENVINDIKINFFIVNYSLNLNHFNKK